MDFTVARSFNSFYILLDIIWLLVYTGVLLYFKRRLAVLIGLAAGLLYFLVDYGYFYTLLGTRQIEGASPFWFLLWMSISYGFTNFTWIWLLLDRDGRAVEWSLLPILGWLAVGLLSQNFNAGLGEITISRGTGAYHGIMALLLVLGYLLLVLQNLKGKDHVNLLGLLAIGIGVQFAWEGALLISGIRPAAWEPLVVNSLIETNLGMPYIYWIHRYITKHIREDLAPVRKER